MDLSLDLKDAINPEQAYFQVYEDYINSHYFNQNNILNEGKIIIIDELNFPLNLFKLHSAIYYFKEVKKSSRSLIQLYNKQFDREYEYKINQMIYFDKAANLLSQVYCINNILSILIEEFYEDANYSNKRETITKFYHLIENLQHRVSTINYFCHLKYLEFLMSYLEVLLEKKKYLKLEPLINEIDEVYKKYKENFLKCKELNYFHFHLDKEYSTTNVLGEFAKQDEQDTIFTFSSFVIPFSYEADDRINEFELRILNAKVQIASEKNINSAESLQKKFKDQLITEFDKNKLRVIEILSIFSAIVLFVNLEVNILSQQTNPITIVSISALLGTVLLLFVNSVFYLTNSQRGESSDKHKKFTKILLWIFIVFIAVVLGIEVYTSKPTIIYNANVF